MKRGVSRKYNESSQDIHYQVIPEGIKLSPRIRIYNISDNKTSERVSDMFRYQSDGYYFPVKQTGYCNG